MVFAPIIRGGNRQVALIGEEWLRSAPAMLSERLETEVMMEIFIRYSNEPKPVLDQVIPQLKHLIAHKV